MSNKETIPEAKADTNMPIKADAANERPAVDGSNLKSNANNVGKPVLVKPVENRDESKREVIPEKVKQTTSKSTIFKRVEFATPDKIALYKCPIITFYYEIEFPGGGLHMTLLFSTVGDPEKQAMINLWNLFNTRYPEVDITVLDDAPFPNTNRPKAIPRLVKVPFLKKHVAMISKFNRVNYIPHVSSEADIKGKLLKGKLKCAVLYSLPGYKPGDLVSAYIGLDNMLKETGPAPISNGPTSEEADMVVKPPEGVNNGVSATDPTVKPKDK